jgi:uncharacterized protein YndB with AHSA1/START domain
MLVGKCVEVAVSLPSEREIAFTCRFERRARLLFEAWTKPEHLKQWWGCEGSSITHCAKGMVQTLTRLNEHTAAMERE